MKLVGLGSTVLSQVAPHFFAQRIYQMPDIFEHNYIFRGKCAERAVHSSVIETSSIGVYFVSTDEVMATS